MMEKKTNGHSDSGIISGKKILIVDDSVSNIKVFGEMLESESAKVSFSFSAREALNLMNDGYYPDLILLDIMMPGMNGFSFKRKLNDHETWCNIPVIVVSALHEQENKALAFDLGCVDFVVKPFQRKEILHRVKVQLKSLKNQEELKRINAELQESNKTREKIFSIISHDLRTSIGNIRNVFKFMIDGHIDPVEDRDILYDSEITSRNTFNLLENLLYWAKSQQGKLVMNPEVFNISRVIKGIIDMEKVSTENKMIELIDSVPEDLEIWADKIFFTISIRNLLANAIKFTSENGRISVIAQQINKEVKISIIDNGIGLSEDQISKLENDKVFTTIGTHNEKGTGLGLILVKDFVKNTNGKLQVKSSKNKGSEFSLIIPSEESIGKFDS